MRKVLAVLAAVALISFMAATASAQEVVSAKASKLTIGGSLTFDAAWRDKGLFVGDYTGYDDGDGSLQDEAFVNTDLILDLSLDFTSNVSAFIRLRADWLQVPEYHNWYDDIFDIWDDFGAQIPGDLWSQESKYLGESGDAAVVEVEEAYIEAREFLTPELTMRAGIMNLVWDLRGNGDEFLLNVNENHTYYGEPYEAGAWWASYNADPLTLEAFVATIIETLAYNEDVALYGARGIYMFDDMSKAMAGLLVINTDDVFDSDDTAQLYAVDLGVDYWLNEDLELYGEAVFEFGNFVWDSYDAKGWGAYLGGKYIFSQVQWTPSVDASFWYLTGPDEDDVDATSYVSLEDVDTFAILEENHYGLDVDHNYWAVKVCASAKPAEDWTLDLKGGYFHLVSNAWIDDSDNEVLGFEVDAAVTWQYSENLALRALVAGLFGSNFLGDQINEWESDIDFDDSGVLAMFSTILNF